ncbi:uncharacterized protein RCC_11245 [Ramularia collo-cygni]|uniref:AMP-dependent synthetase/ligase domain-containing protein n=1 Tax=Ramularia collo-cygni TaxID=112498 RepID=A0A2D3VJ75_9PEZI|nr:uncharacterized protein RCC_11245 [Ramularia collo-cygni]CZT25512.1 uncharacterized protein RCC_11245 [Ramularia collo-cygni]
MAIAQVYSAFFNGGALAVAPFKARGDPAVLSQMMYDYSIELTIYTPSEYQLLLTYAGVLLRKCTSWTNAYSGGEIMPLRLLDAMQRLDLPSLTLTDCYGPTEASCAATFKSIPISFPIG